MLHPCMAMLSLHKFVTSRMELNVVIILGLLVAITSCLEKPNIVILFADDVRTVICVLVYICSV